MTTPHTGAPLLGPGASAAGHEARRAAERKRGMVVSSLSMGLTTFWGVIAMVDRSRDPHYLKLSLRELLLACGKSHANTSQIIFRLRRALGAKRGKLNLAWLLDEKVGSKRVLALADQMAPSTYVPWEGFPFSPPPVDIDAMARQWKAPLPPQARS